MSLPVSACVAGDVLVDAFGHFRKDVGVEQGLIHQGPAATAAPP